MIRILEHRKTMEANKLRISHLQYKYGTAEDYASNCPYSIQQVICFKDIQCLKTSFYLKDRKGNLNPSGYYKVREILNKAYKQSIDPNNNFNTLIVSLDNMYRFANNHGSKNSTLCKRSSDPIKNNDLYTHTKQPRLIGYLQWS